MASYTSIASSSLQYELDPDFLHVIDDEEWTEEMLEAPIETSAFIQELIEDPEMLSIAGTYAINPESFYGFTMIRPNQVDIKPWNIQPDLVFPKFEECFKNLSEAYGEKFRFCIDIVGTNPVFSSFDDEDESEPESYELRFVFYIAK